MGKEYFKRPLMTAGTTAGTTSGSVGNLRLGGNLVLPSESKTGTAPDQSLSDHGVSFITIATSNLANQFVLPNPPAAGALKYVCLDINTTSGNEFRLHAGGTAAGSSASVFFGTTANTIAGQAFAAGTTFGRPVSISLVGVSTSQWAITNISCSTDVLILTGSTGSTSQN